MDALTGRMLILRLHPLSQLEIEQKQDVSFLDKLFSKSFSIGHSQPLGNNLVERIIIGGYPPALAMTVNSIRSAWYNSYVISLLQNDVYEQKKIHFVESLPRLLTAVATLSGQLLNVSALSKKLQMNRNTILQYLSLLERQFLIEKVPAWHTNRMKRLIKTPKIHVGDSGLACSLLGIDAHDLKNDPNLLGHLMESFVLQELS